MELNQYHSNFLQYFKFQPEAIQFLIDNKKAVMGLPTGSGKTIVGISSFTYTKMDNKKAKCIYVTDKSVIAQTVKTVCQFFNLKHEYVYEHSAAIREKIYQNFINSGDILVLNYAMLRQDTEDFEEIFDKVGAENLVLILDEANYVAGITSKIHNIVKGMCKYLNNVVALTATPSKGKLEDFYNILIAMGKTTLSREGFYHRFVNYETVLMCNMKIGNLKIATSMCNVSESGAVIRFNLEKLFKDTGFSYIGDHDNISVKNNTLQIVFDESPSKYMVAGVDLKSAKQKKKRVLLHFFTVDKIVGYKNLNKFKARYAKVLYSKSKKDVMEDLPPFTKQILEIDEDKETHRAISLLYREGNPNSSVLKIALAYPQYVEEAAVKAGFINNKMAVLLTLIDNNLYNEKAIIYSPSKNVINYAAQLVRKAGYGVSMITGDITKTRELEKEKFISGETQFMFITDAGAVGVDGLQVTNNIVFLGMPGTGGQFVQLCGRISRIGSIHNSLNLIFLLTKNSNDVDTYSSIMSQVKLMQVLDKNSVDEGLCDLGAKEMTEEESDKFLKVQIESRRSQYRIGVTKAK